LEGCDPELLASVAEAFNVLYAKLATLLSEAVQMEDGPLSHALMVAWALDFESTDAQLLLHSGVLSCLQHLVSLRTAAEDARSLFQQADGPPAVWDPVSAKVSQRTLTQGSSTHTFMAVPMYTHVGQRTHRCDNTAWVSMPTFSSSPGGIRA
jgi:hypothetical protein